MNDRPIRFSGPMVRALLSGTKTQTRRIVKPQPFANNNYHRGDVQASECAMRSTGDPACFNFGVTAVDGEGGLIETVECPYGCPGDRLWVRETWQCGQTPADGPDQEVWFSADSDGHKPADVEEGEWTWRPSIHMPRWASRITLEITRIRVERLNEISDADCIAEGIDPGTVESFRHAGADRPEAHAYRQLWESINGPGSWDANPWVWVVEFKRVEPA